MIRTHYFAKKDSLIYQVLRPFYFIQKDILDTTRELDFFVMSTKENNSMSKVEIHNNTICIYIYMLVYTTNMYVCIFFRSILYLFYIYIYIYLFILFVNVYIHAQVQLK